MSQELSIRTRTNQSRPSTGNVAAPATPSQPLSSIPPPVSLITLEDRCLLKIFSYLTVGDVLNVSTINRTFYKRVDKLFGIGTVGIQSQNDRNRAKPNNPAGNVPINNGPVLNDKVGDYLEYHICLQHQVIN